MNYSAKVWSQTRVKEQLVDNIKTYLQSSGSEVHTGTGDGFRLEPHKHAGPQAVIHVIPKEKQNTHRKT